MNVSRLLDVSFKEVACRGKQAIAKRLDRLGGRPSVTFTVPRSVGGTAADVSVRQVWDGPASEETAVLVRRLAPAAAESIVGEADRIREGYFEILRYGALHFGTPIDWHLDPIHARRSPIVHWSRLDPLDPATVGDSKIVWELNRHQWAVRLGQAYRLTADARYRDTFVTYVDQWLAANPCGVGINWSSSLELALRLMSWVWALALFADAAGSSAFRARMTDAIIWHARHIEIYLSRYFSPNTHLTGEALGLFYAGVTFPSLPRARRWRELGAEILGAETQRQIHDDGGHFEQSTCYQRYTLEIYLHFLLLARRHDVDVPAAAVDRVRRLVDFALTLRGPDGRLPTIGDDDGGTLLPLGRRDAADFRDLFSTAAIVFGSPEYAWAADGLAPETVWLLGPRALRESSALRPRMPASGSTALVNSGYVVMRSGTDRKAHQLIFDVGPLGCPVSGGHGHADLLSVQCSVFGEPMLVDAGTFTYTATRQWRDFFRGTAAHSTVTVDGMPQAVTAGPFKWKHRPHAWLRRWTSTPRLDVAEGEHDAYRELADPVRHRRRVVFPKPRYWVIVDDLSGTADHQVQAHWQFTALSVTLEADGWARARHPNGHGLLIHAWARAALSATVLCGDVNPIRGWASDGYGERHPAPLLVYRLVDRLPTRIVTVLIPVEDASADAPAVDVTESLAAIRVRPWDDTIELDGA
jgi:heparinase II/III-like protein